MSVNPTDQAKPFLWGPVKNALILDAQKHGLDKLLTLCRTGDQRVKEMMVSVLTDYGRDDPAGIAAVLAQLLPPHKQVPSLQRAWRLAHPTAQTFELKASNARKIAVEVAANLGMGSALKTAALHDDPATRAAAVRYLHYFWEQNHAAGFEILEQLAGLAVPGLVPDLTAFESVFGLSAILFFDHADDREVLLRLQGIWREILGRLLGVQAAASRPSQMARAFLRERVFSFAVGAAFRLIREMPAGYVILNEPDLQSFFKRSRKDKELYLRLLRYLDPDDHPPQMQMEADFRAAIPVSDALIGMVGMTSLIAQTGRAPSAPLEFFKSFLEEAAAYPIPNTWVREVVGTIEARLELNPETDAAFPLFVQSLDIFQSYYAKHPQIPGLTYTFHGPDAAYLCVYAAQNYRRTGDIGAQFLETRIQAALENHRMAFFEALLGQELPFTGIDMRMPQVALAVTALIFPSGDPDIDGLIKRFLARLRLHYPDEVDDFLDEQQASPAFQLDVRTNEPIETVGELIGLRTWLFVRDGLVFGSPTLRAQFMRILAKAADFPTARPWLDYLLREIINLIYGADVLRQPH